MRTLSRSIILAALLPLLAQAPRADAAPPTIGGCQVFPANHYWNTPIDQLPVDTANSTNWVNSIGATTKLHPDWGNAPSEIASFGIPFITGAPPPIATVTFDPDAADESDPNPYRIPSNAPVEGGAGSGGDMHVISIDTQGCKLYELYSATQTSTNTWSAYSGAIFDLNSNALRPDGYTSADASGLAIFPGLLRWEEVFAGEIEHAIRFTAPRIWATVPGGHKYLWPARHWSGNTNNSLYPPMGARFRLKASFNISGFDQYTQRILRAFKKYGMVLVDGGSSWFFQGVSSTQWPDVVMNQLKSIDGGNFEVVDTSLLQIDPNSAQAVQLPAAPAGLAATPGNGQASLAFGLPANGGAPITSFRVTCTAGMLTASATGAASPIVVTGMTNGTSYSCSVAAANRTGFGAASAGIAVTTGLPALSLSTTSLGFGAVLVTSGMVTLPVIFTNSGSGNLNLISIVLAGAAVSDFTTGGSCDPLPVLTPGMSCTLNITFDPTATGTRSASVTISSDVPQVTLAVTGIGASAPAAPTIASSIAGDGQASFYITPGADGGSPLTGFAVTCNPGGVTLTAAPSPVSPITLALVNDTVYTCTATASNAFGSSPPSASVNVTPSAMAALALVRVSSRKTHGGNGTHDLPIDRNQTIGGNVSVEPRMLGAGHKLVFEFNRTVGAAGSVSAVDAALAPVGDPVAAAIGKEVVVTLTGIADNSRARVALVNVDGAGLDVAASLGFLVGDVSGSRRVTASDISAVKSRLNQGVTPANFRFDLNASGMVDAADVTAVKARSGRSLP